MGYQLLEIFLVGFVKLSIQLQVILVIVESGSLSTPLDEIIFRTFGMQRNGFFRN